MSQQGSSCTQVINEDCRDIIFDRLVDLCQDKGFYVATKLEKFLKKNVATFLTHVATLIKHIAMKLMSLCRDKRQLCCDTKSIVSFEGQETLSQ